MSHNNGNLLEISELTLDFGGLRVLDHVSAVVPKGEVVALVGPNGAGKSSMLNCINGFYKPSLGSITLNGEEITGQAPHLQARHGIARSFQQVELVPSATVLENIMVGRHIFFRSGWFASMIFWGSAYRDEMRQHEVVEETLELLELEPYRDRRAGDLAFGIQQLVGVARALAMQPQLLLLDEPSSGMSRQEKEDLARFLQRVRSRLQTTILWVEHDTQMIKDLADSAIVLQYGRKIFEGTAQAAMQDPQVIEAYIGRPATS